MDTKQETSNPKELRIGGPIQVQTMSDRPVKDVSLNYEDGQDKQVNTGNSTGFARRGGM